MRNLKLIVLLQLCVAQAVWIRTVYGENLSHAEAAVLPYSLKTSNTNNNDERYKILAMNPINDQTNEEELVETNNRNNKPKRRNDDPWDRLSLHYKTQLAQVNPVDDFGYYNPHSVAPLNYRYPTDMSHFGIGIAAVSLPLTLIVIVNIGMLLYSFIGILSALSTTVSGLNFRHPYHPYIRREEKESKYN